MSCKKKNDRTACQHLFRNIKQWEYEIWWKENKTDAQKCQFYDMMHPITKRKTVQKKSVQMPRILHLIYWYWYWFWHWYWYWTSSNFNSMILNWKEWKNTCLLLKIPPEKKNEKEGKIKIMSNCYNIKSETQCHHATMDIVLLNVKFTIMLNGEGKEKGGRKK